MRLRIVSHRFQEYRLTNGLNEIVHCSQSETDLFLVHYGNDNDRDVCRFGSYSQGCQYLEAIPTRHHYIQGDCVGPKVPSLLNSRFSRLCHGNAVIGREITGDQLTGGDVVVDDEDKRLAATFICHDQWARRFNHKRTLGPAGSRRKGKGKSQTFYHLAFP